MGHHAVKMVCTDCGSSWRDPGAGAPVSHGLCVRCFSIRIGAVPANELRDWLDSEIDALPTGKIVLDQDLRVIGYNRAEEQLTGLDGSRLIGKIFFSEVAPCMSAREVSCWCAEHVACSDIHEKFIDWFLPLHSGDCVASLEIAAGQGRVVIRVDVSKND